MREELLSFYKNLFFLLSDTIKYSTSNLYRKREEILLYILKKIVKFTKAKAGNIRVYDPQTKTLILLSSYGTSKKYKEEKKEIKVGESIAGMVIEKRKPIAISDIRESKIYIKSNLAIEENMISLISCPLICDNKVFGTNTLYFSYPKKFNKEEKEFFYTLSNFISLVIRLQDTYYELEETYTAIINSLIIELEQKDRYLKGHSEKVREYSIKIGKKLGLSRDEIKILSNVSVLHDIGKLFIDSSILNKKEKLTEAEWMIIKRHPLNGERILLPLRKIRDGISIVRHHHERIDGKGYPDGISGNKISLLARIVSVADALDAMSSKRPYRETPLSLEEIKNELKKNMGTQFDPEIVKVTLELIEDGKIKLKRK
jgi:HD-GYP domain-containing protein (c-di-GMP phosphodiesterase class II)